MTVMNLWNVCDDWTPYTSVEIFDLSDLSTASFDYFEGVLKEYSDRKVDGFSVNNIQDKITIKIVK